MGEVRITRKAALGAVRVYSTLLGVFDKEGIDPSEVAPMMQLKSAIKKIQKANDDEYNDLVHSLRLKYCQRDPKTLAVVTDGNGQFSFTSEKFKEFSLDLAKLDAEEISVVIHPVDTWSDILSLLPGKYRMTLGWEDVEEYLTHIVNP